MSDHQITIHVHLLIGHGRMVSCLVLPALDVAWHGIAVSWNNKYITMLLQDKQVISEKRAVSWNNKYITMILENKHVISEKRGTPVFLHQNLVNLEFHEKSN
jgi:c-di-AMP phosphodiesterase-like protein